MHDYEDLNYEINEVFNYIIKKPNGTIKNIIDDLSISKNDILIIVNIFNKSDLISRYKYKDESKYSLSKIITPISFGKAVNMGIDIDNLNKHFEVEKTSSLKELTYFIESGELEKAIEEEESKKKEDYLLLISEKCNEDLAQMAINEHLLNINNVIEKQKLSVNTEQNESINRVLNDIYEELNNEFNKLKNKMIEKRIRETR